MRVLSLVLCASLFFSIAFAADQKDSFGNVAFADSNTISIDSLIIDPGNANVIYALGRNHGIFKSTDSGETWTFSGNGISEKWITSLVIDPLDSRTLYAGTLKGIYKSMDAGVSWGSNSLKGLIYKIVIQKTTPPSMYASTGSGLFKSNNAGETWQEIPRIDKYAFVSPLESTPAEPEVSYASIGIPNDVIVWKTNDEFKGNGLYRSTDRGDHWRKLSSISVSVLAFAPDNPKTIYAGGKGMSKSTDGGITWQEKGSGIPKSGITSLVIDPKNPEVLYVTTSYASGGHLPFYNWATSRVYKSVDGGETWEKASGFPVNCLVIDPNNSQKLYAATPGGGVFTSNDAGESWKPSNSGLIDDSIR